MGETLGDPKRILHLISASGNWEPFTRVAGLAAAMREHGYSSAVAAPDHSRLWEMAEGAGVDVVDYTLERSLNPLRWKDLAAMIKASGAGIVHTHDADAAALVARAGLFLGNPGIVTSRYDMDGGVSGAEHGGKVNAVVCASQAMAEMYLAAGAPKEKVHVVYSGANEAVAARSEEERSGIRAAYRDQYCPDNEKPLFIVSIAPFTANGCQQDFLEAMPDILAALPQAHLFLMGEGPNRDELQRQMKLLAIKNEVTLLEPDKAYHRLLAAADLYVAWAKDDYAGLMAQAAMTAGRGVLLRNSGCHEELVESGVSGVLANAGSGADSLKTAALDILTNRSRREKLGAGAKRRAAQQFGSKACAAKLAEIYAKSV